jgi:competence protein ComEC
VLNSSRAPAMSVFVCLGLGTWLDHSFPLSLWLWTTIACGALALSRLCVMARTQAWLLAVMLLALGAASHHRHRSLVETTHLLRFVPEEGQPGRIRGRVVERPVIIPRQPERQSWQIPEYDQTRLVIEAEEWITEQGPIPACGRVWTDVDGQVVGLSTGDAVEAVGRFYRPGPRVNPGGFDFREYLARRNLHVALACDQPEALQRLGRTRSLGTWMARWRDRVRQRVERVLNDSLDPSTAGLGVALLLGTRSNMDSDLREAFAESGSMHLLAISGANVVVYSGVLWALTAFVTGRRRLRLAVLMVGLPAYLWLADWQSPVFRAVVMLELVLWSQWRGRPVQGWNSLGVAGVAGWLVNPQDLFDVGAQLSFLAVAGLICSGTWSRGLEGLLSAGERDSDELAPVPAPKWRGLWRSLGRAWWFWLVSSCSVWVFTLPISLTTFHLFSGVGFLLGVVLSPLSAVLLGLGYVTLIAAASVASLAFLPGHLFDLSLQGLVSLVTQAANWPLGHVYLAGPSAAWTLVFYVLLLGGIALVRRGVDWRRPTAALALWMAGGLVWSLLPHGGGSLEVTMLSVGHGGATLVECPNGRTLLFDCGRLQDHDRARQIVQSALWSKGHSRIDVVVLSHADIDHFNALPGLLETMPVGQVLIHPSFLEWSQPAVRDLIETVAKSDTPLRLVWAGDRVRLDREVEIVVAGPEPLFRSTDDNANSVSLALRYRDKSLLLTGDLEKEGLAALLRSPPLRVDVLQAPHHGSPKANPKELDRWSNPAWVWIAGGRHETALALQDTYARAEAILSTRDHGALVARISSGGQLSITTGRPLTSRQPTTFVAR